MPQVAPTWRTKSGCQDRGLKFRWRLHLFQGVQTAQRTRDRRDQWGALLACIHMEIESRLLDGLKKPVKIIAQACFGLFASPVHTVLRARFQIRIPVMTG